MTSHTITIMYLSQEEPKALHSKLTNVGFLSLQQQLRIDTKNREKHSEMDGDILTHGDVSGSCAHNWLLEVSAAGSHPALQATES